MSELTQGRRRVFAAVAWITLVFNVFVILGGTIVRATGSGDGCGDTWPKCGDRLVPPNATIETLIEFSHRASSFLAGLGVAAVVILALWLFPKGHIVKKAATVSGSLLVVEALLGAALVLYGWVDADISVGRMIVVPLHLTNTFLLLGALAVTAWWGTGLPAPRERSDPGPVRWLAIGAIVIVVLGATGALNALADTIFPSDSVTGGLAEKFGSTAPLLSKLRIVHPVVAVAGGMFVAWIAAGQARFGSVNSKRLSAAVSIIVLSQFFIGIANIFLLTPLAVQVIHLMVADLLWVVYVLFSASRLGDAVRAPNRQAVLA
ncbi:MAG: COX15/CtaA family protein [Acidimicrobiia bacterium]|nr:MAG: COX15/CtaA family protein [Acidimicrobiia bacterium]